MSWCDKLASVPAVGLFHDPHYSSGDGIIDAVSPLLNKWRSGGKPDFTVVQTEPLKVEIQHDNGFTYSFHPNRTSVSFHHRVRFRHVSGGRPVAELISSPQPFTKLLDDAIRTLIDVSLLLPKAKERSFQRLGILSNTFADEKDIPPGVRRYVEYATAPWGHRVAGYGISIIGLLAENPGYTDRCIYTFTKKEEVEEIPSYKFDWQRLYGTPHPIEKEALQKEIAQAKKAALEYLELVATGDAFDVTDKNTE